MSHADLVSDGMTAATGRISVKRTLASAYRILAGHAVSFAVIVAALAIVNDGCAYLGRLMVDEPSLDLTAVLIEGGGTVAGMVLAEILSVIVGVAWFRIILLNEPHRVAGYLRFGAREFRYLGVDLLFGFLVSAPFLIVGAATMLASEGEMAWLESYGYPLIAGTFVWSAVCAAWLGLAYPALATDAPGGSLRLSLALSHGQRLPLFAAFLLGQGAWNAALLAVLYLAPEETGDLQPIGFVATLLSFLARISFVAVSAAAYGQLQRRSDASMAAAFD
jgi:hypothetical protein